MTYDGRAVANFILDHCDQKRRSVHHTALQKIVYFCHVWSLVSLGQPLVKQKFEAWEFGPVLPYLYREFRGDEGAPIKTRAKQINALDGTSRIVGYDFDSKTVSLLEDIIEFYSRMQSKDLTELSHVAEGPWDKVWNHAGLTKPGMKIDDLEIAKFYSRIPCPFTVQ